MKDRGRHSIDYMTSTKNIIRPKFVGTCI